MNHYLSTYIRIILFLVFAFSCAPKKETSTVYASDREQHRKKEVVIFVYHRFGNNTYPSTNISLAAFDNHLDYLKTNNFTVLTFGAAVDYIHDPTQAYIEKVACITVDDGYKTFKSNALPILNKYGFKATVFINSESVGGGAYMDWEALRQVNQEGIEIGNHSHSHAYFLNTPADKRIGFFKKDLQICQEEINTYLGFYPDIFAYPYGEFDLEMKSILKELGFKAAAAQNSGVMYQNDNYAIPRFPMAGPYVKMEGFIEKANMKALRIISKEPASFLLNDQNPPILKVAFDTAYADLSRHNCFTSGKCETRLNGNTMTIQAAKALTGRRTLYTITAPSRKGNEWYWFSHLWIRPEIKE